VALIFTPRADVTVRVVALSLLAGGGVTLAAMIYYFTPKYTRVGYSPDQPVPFSHQQHVGQLGIDCRYCHQAVTESPHSTVPTAETCMGCHSVIKTDSPALAPIRLSYESSQGGNPGVAVPWKRIHKVPDYAYFNHAVHVNRGVSCVSCHGKVNEMKVVYQHEPQSMSWCLDCHRNPTDRLRPDLASVLDLNWGDNLTPEKRLLQQKVKEERNIKPPENCQSCHR
jgi:formate-dependent nitrite reductase cytochrome c552 subunit